MITKKVIQEIYKNYNRPAKSVNELDLDRIAEVLQPWHILDVSDDDEVIVMTLDEFSPFRRFLKRSIHAVLEFDHNVAFVFESHIIFFSKDDERISVDFKPDKKKSFFDRLFGGN